MHGYGSPHPCPRRSAMGAPRSHDPGITRHRILSIGQHSVPAKLARGISQPFFGSRPGENHLMRLSQAITCFLAIPDHYNPITTMTVKIVAASGSCASSPNIFWYKDTLSHPFVHPRVIDSPRTRDHLSSRAAVHLDRCLHTAGRSGSPTPRPRIGERGDHANRTPDRAQQSNAGSVRSNQMPMLMPSIPYGTAQNKSHRQSHDRPTHSQTRFLAGQCRGQYPPRR